MAHLNKSSKHVFGSPGEIDLSTQKFHDLSHVTEDVTWFRDMLFFDMLAHEHFNSMIKQFIWETSNFESMDLVETMEEINMTSTADKNIFREKLISRRLQLSLNGTKISVSGIKKHARKNIRVSWHVCEKCSFSFEIDIWKES